MSLVLLNLQSKQQIKLNNDDPFIIGRANVLGCSDKRVSRSHGKITCTVDGKIHVVALHSNPCFYTRNGVPPVQQLNKDEGETLNEGDCLGLLPNAFWFQVTTDREIKIKTERNELGSEVNYPDKSDALQKYESDLDSIATVVKTCSKPKENQNSLSPKPSTSSTIPEKNVDLPTDSKDESGQSSSSGIEKTRKLPLWMYEIDEVTSTKKSPVKRTLLIKIKSNSKKAKTPSVEGTSKTDLPTSNLKVKDEVIESDSPSTSRHESGTTAFCESLKDGNGEPSKKNTKEEYESDVNEPTTDTRKRPICQYEGNCYRKNPQHKLDFSHPGDPDFVNYEQRPVCEYGAACYRKYAKHKVDYWHPPRRQRQSPSSISSYSSSPSQASPLPAKRRRKTINRQESDYGDDDDYDLEDPFINDASSDEFLPSDWESEEELESSLQDD